jgi:hypothetical protein
MMSDPFYSNNNRMVMAGSPATSNDNQESIQIDHCYALCILQSGCELGLVVDYINLVLDGNSGKWSASRYEIKQAINDNQPAVRPWEQAGRGVSGSIEPGVATLTAAIRVSIMHSFRQLVQETPPLHGQIRSRASADCAKISLPRFKNSIL